MVVHGSTRQTEMKSYDRGLPSPLSTVEERKRDPRTTPDPPQGSPGDDFPSDEDPVMIAPPSEGAAPGGGSGQPIHIPNGGAQPDPELPSELPETVSDDKEQSEATTQAAVSSSTGFWLLVFTVGGGSLLLNLD